MIVSEDRFNAVYKMFIPLDSDATYSINLVLTAPVESKEHRDSLSTCFTKKKSKYLSRLCEEVVASISAAQGRADAESVLEQGSRAFADYLSQDSGAQFLVLTAEPAIHFKGEISLSLPQIDNETVLIGNLYPPELSNILMEDANDMLICALRRSDDDSAQEVNSRIRQSIRTLWDDLMELAQMLMDMETPKKVVGNANIDDVLALKDGIVEAIERLKAAQVFLVEPDVYEVVDLRPKEETLKKHENERFFAQYHFDAQTLAGAPRSLDMLVGIPLRGEDSEDIADKFRGEWAYVLELAFDDLALTQLRTMPIDEASEAIEENLPKIRKRLSRALSYEESEVICSIMYPSRLSFFQTDGQYEATFAAPPYKADTTGQITGTGSVILIPIDVDTSKVPPAFLSIDCEGFTEEKYKTTLDLAYLYLPLLCTTITNGISSVSSIPNTIEAAAAVRDVLRKIAPIERIRVNLADMTAISTVYLRGGKNGHAHGEDGKHHISFALNMLPYVVHIHLNLADGDDGQRTIDLFSIITIESESQRERLKQIANSHGHDIVKAIQHMAIYNREGDDASPGFLYIGGDSLEKISRQIAETLHVSPSIVYTVASSPISAVDAGRCVRQEPDYDPNYTPFFLRTNPPDGGGGERYAVLLVEREGSLDQVVTNDILTADTTTLQQLANIAAYDDGKDNDPEKGSSIGRLFQAISKLTKGRDAKFFPVDTSFLVNAGRTEQ